MGSNSASSNSGLSVAEGSQAHERWGQLLRAFERGFGILILFLGSGAVILGLLRTAGPTEDPKWIQGVWGTMYVLTAGLLVLRRNQVRRAFRLFVKAPVLLGLTIFALLSFTWAADTALTGLRVIILIGTTLMGTYLAVRFSLYQIFRFAGIALFIGTVLSFLVVPIFPEFGLYYDARGYGLQGVFGNKNILGRATSLGAAFAFFLWRDKRIGSKRFWLVAFSLCALATLLSQSKTSLVALIAVIGISPSFELLRTRGKLLVPALTVLAVLAAALIATVLMNSSYLLNLLGRDATLSGRIPVWTTTLIMIWSRPWLGYGYGADWVEEVGAFAYLFREYFERWQPTHAHNGLLQLGFELGLVGVGLFLVHFVVFAKRSIQWVRIQQTSFASYLPLAFLITLFASNLTQSTVLSRNNIYWILYVAISLSLVRLLRANGRVAAA
jgi:O-antigen ligase